MRKTNKELHRRLQKAESKAMNVFKTHNPQMAQLKSDAAVLSRYADKLRILYKSEWRKFQTDDPKFLEVYGDYCDKFRLFEKFKSWVKGK